VPKWRIVSEELWNAVQERIVVVSERFGNRRYGGMNRTEQSRRYLFSGLLICGICKSRMVIGSGRGKRGYVRYACPSHRYRGVCSNKLTIRQDRLEEQLLAALEERLLKPEMIEHVIQRVNTGLRQQLAEINKRSNNSAGLQGQRHDLQAQAQRLVTAIAKSGDSPSLLSGLAEVESALVQIDQQLKMQSPIDLEGNMVEIREFVSKNLFQLRTFLTGDPTLAKSALTRHIKQLVLTPAQLATGPVFEVSGNVELAPNTAGADVMLMVARDGIEPPTPAFSGLYSANSISLI
jgi:site-specific DNA recombinase